MHPLIVESCVISQVNEQTEVQLIAFYTLSLADEDINSEYLRLYLKDKIPDYMIPMLFIKQKEFPLTPNGKLDKHALTYIKSAEHDPHVLNVNEAHLLPIWQHAFQTSSINVTDNFFELGGHSLIATRLISNIAKTFNKRINIEDLYYAPCIRDLAQLLENKDFQIEELSTTESIINFKKLIPLSDFQLLFWLSHFFEPKVKQLNIVGRRRVRGRINIERLNIALNAVVEKHVILSSKISKWLPKQVIKKKLLPAFHDNDLTCLAEDVLERYLTNSLTQLANTNLWQSDNALLKITLFYLPNGLTELQLCASHFIFDDISESIFFSDLSSAYLNHNQIKKIAKIQNQQYEHYVWYEKSYLNKQVTTDIAFWSRYFDDTTLAAFPNSMIVTNITATGYSSYIKLPSTFMLKLKTICKQELVSMTDAICASISLALKSTIGDLNKSIVINIIRSTRTNSTHDNMIGCYLTLDSLKLNLSSNEELINLAKSIQVAKSKTEPYQSCSGMIKVACLNHKNLNTLFHRYLIPLMINFMSIFLYPFKIHRKLLLMYTRLNALREKDRFIINLNILTSFIKDADENVSTLFDSDSIPTPLHQHDMSTIDNVLDICFLKDKADNQPYLVISANLLPLLREKIGSNLIQNISQYE